MSPRTYKRRRKLIKPRLQLRLVMTFTGLASLALLLQVVLLASRLSSAATLLPLEGHVLSRELPGLLLEILLISFGVLLPLTITVGVLATFRIAGPLYRFEQFLRAVARGEHPEECRIRKNDELQDFCALLNEVTEPLRRAQPSAAPEPAVVIPEPQESVAA